MPSGDDYSGFNHIRRCFWNLVKHEAYLLKQVRAESHQLFLQNNSIRDIRWVQNTPLIFKLLREKLGGSSFHDNINSLLNYSSRGICPLCNILSILEVTLFVHFYFLQSLSVMLQCPVYCNIKFFISTSILNKVI